MRHLAAICLAISLGFGPGQVAAQPAPVPERRTVLSEDVDFYGGDLRAIFDTTFEACSAACLGDGACQAFTYNTRSGACFPKTGVTRRDPYAGARSAVVLETPARVLAEAATRRAELGFLRPSDFQAARAAAEGMALLHPVGDVTAGDYLRSAEASRAAGERADAAAFTGAAVVLTDAPELFLAYAEDLLAIPGYDDDRPSRALWAAVNGYLRAGDAALRASALMVMSQALEKAGRGDDTVPALRLAASLSPREDIAAALDRAIGRFGFRIVGNAVESDSAQPRICAEFSAPLAEAGVDYGAYVQLRGEGLVVEPAGDRLCIRGVRHGERQEVTFRAGLPSASGETMARPVTLNLYVRDRSPSVAFPGRAYVLPRAGEAAVPVVTVNAGALDLALYRASDRNLLRAVQDGYLGRQFTYWREPGATDAISAEIWRGTGTVETVLNQEVTTRLPLGELIAGLEPGLYTLMARVTGVADDYGDATAAQSFVVSDLGLATMSGTDGLHVFARGLGDALPREGLTVTLLSQTNSVLGSAVTDAEGYASFAAGLTRGTGGLAPELVVAEDGAGDIAFLSLTEPEFDLSDRGVEGREAAPPIDLFLATDRGAYRAGETIRLTVLARDGEAAAIEGLPLTAILERPDGVEYSRFVSTESAAGGHVFALPVGATAPRGGWTIRVHADPGAPPLASRSVLVEDFLPERIDFDLTLTDAPIAPSDRPLLRLAARYLFGAPAGDLAVEGTVRLAGTRELPDRPGYFFGRHDAPFDAGTEVFGGLRTGPDGRAEVTVEFPATGLADRPLRAEITATVSEGSGRPVERRIDRILTPAAPLIGIRPDFDGVAGYRQPAGFRLIALGTDGGLTAMPVKWQLNRLRTEYQWYRTYGTWEWEPVTRRESVASGTLALTAEGPAALSVLVDWGRYELRVERDGGGTAVGSVDFYAGWYAPADVSQTPDTLDVSLDAPAYRAGDTARVTIVPRYAGRGLVTVMSNRLIAMRAVDLAEGENIVELPVTDEWGAGAYVSATLIRPMDAGAGRNPARALGLAHAGVDPGARRLAAEFQVAAASDPRAPLDVALKVAGVAPGETAYASIAAVDVGILNLTGFESPDPEGHYFGQRKLGIGLRDVYGRLIDGLNGALGEVRSGGDAALRRGFESPPPTEELVAQFAGPVTVGPDGLARARFDMPAFNGTVRLMAVVWSKSGVGQAEAEVLVRDPVVLTASLPRFLAPGDESRMLLEIVHATGPAGRMGLSVTAEGLTLAGTVPAEVQLAPLGKAIVEVPLRAGATGTQRLRVALVTPEGRELVKDLTLPVRVNDPEIARQSRFALPPGASFRFDAEVFAGLYPGTATATIAAGPLARLDAPGLLAMLDRYPYGCTEQLASAAMPLIYFDGIAEAMGLARRDEVRERVDLAIRRVLTNQAANGAFGLWRPGAGDMWLDAYVSDFLSRARAEGFEVPDRAFRLAMDNLRNQVNYYPDFDAGGADLAYALYVLAREGAAAVGDLRYYADAKGDAFSTPLAAAQIGAALAAYGDPARADAMFARAGRMAGAPTSSETLWRADFGTPRRDAAGVLALAVEAGSRAVDRDLLIGRIAEAGAGLSTQEAVWALLAARAMITAPDTALTVDGVPAEGPLVRFLDGATGGAPVAIRNEGDRPAELTLSTFGVPSEPEPEGGNGWRIARSYYTLEGRPADPALVASGTRLVTVLEIRPLGRREARLMVNDPLPAGFEIDNPNLMRAGDIGALDWLGLDVEPAYSEFRADRFLAAVDYLGEEPFRLAYIVRAISPGAFRHPAASVEDMYRPEFRARTAAGRVTVTP